MNVKEQGFTVTEEEMIILNAFFLALPMPSLMARNEASNQLNFKETLRKTSQGLIDKGWVSTEISQQQKDLVIPELACLLRDIAYGNQILHLYYQKLTQEAVQIAFYRRATRIVCQRLFNQGVHIIQPYGNVLGKHLLEDYLSEIQAGEKGNKTWITLDFWQYLLSSRAALIGEDVSTALEAIAQTTKDDLTRLKFAKDVLSAASVLELTAVYDRINKRSEKVSFVFQGNVNWLVLRPSFAAAKDLLLIMAVPRMSVLQTIDGLMLPFTEESIQERKDS